MRKILLTAAVAVALSGCVTYDKLAKETNDLIAQAETEIQAANKTEYLWRDTEKFLKGAQKTIAAAKKANAAGDSAKAKELAGKAKDLAAKARDQALMAQQQAKDNANAAPRYPN